MYTGMTDSHSMQDGAGHKLKTACNLKRMNFLFLELSISSFGLVLTVGNKLQKAKLWIEGDYCSRDILFNLSRNHCSSQM